MRVIVVNDYGSVTGGAAQVALASLNELANLGLDVTFVSSVGPIDKNIDTKKIRVINFGLHDLLSNPSRLKSAINGIWSFRCARLFGEVLDEYCPRNTVIHFHGWVKSLSSSVIYEALRRHFKIVVTLHDYFSICPNGGLFDYVKNEHCSVEAMSLECARCNCDSRSRSHKVWRFARHLIQNKFSGMPVQIKNFITVSDYSENLLKPYMQPGTRFFRVRNPIDIDRISPPSVSQRDRFIFVGRLSPEKGALLFARAAKIANVYASFVGQGSEDVAIREANPEAVLLGWNDRHGVISHMRASRALVFPSILHETQGLAVMEAAAVGIPTIVSDGCAAQDSIIDGETGLLFRAGDVDDLAQKIFYLKSNPEIALQMGKSAFEKYWSNPSTLANHAKELISSYEMILSQN